MRRKNWIYSLLFLGCIASFSCVAPLWAVAGDEDVKEEVKKPPPEIPVEAEPQMPEEPEVPDLSLGDEPEVQPEYKEPVTQVFAKSKKGGVPWDPDQNVDYSEMLNRAEPQPHVRGVLPPALGFRGYRPNMIALGYMDRTPGYGVMLEYSWNRIAAGVYYSYRKLPSTDLNSYTQSFGGYYMLYRWLPFDFSPYFLLGLELASQAPEGFGGLAGVGMEAKVYRGITALFGYTYHSTVRRGFLGGALGWSF